MLFRCNGTWVVKMANKHKHKTRAKIKKIKEEKMKIECGGQTSNEMKEK